MNMTHYPSYYSPYYSQLRQDAIVDTLLNKKYNGFFLDIGACYWGFMSNSCFFEKERNWSGIGVELNSKHKEGWEMYRKNSIFHTGDATKIDYQLLLDSNNAPKIIDYLSIDVDPPTTLSLESLYKIFESDYHFNVITFECDYGGDVECNFQRPGTRDESRKFLTSKGYVLLAEIYEHVKPWYHVDDLWVHESIYDASMKDVV
jgi:hypothetical protein